MARPLISLVMIVRDEARHLGRCLASVAGLAGEIVVVDTGSTDGTVEIARGFGARVFGFPWVDDFAAARNESLRRARGDWAFWLDADEWLDDENRARLGATLDRLGPDDRSAYLIGQHSRLGEDGGAALSVVQPRLFRLGPEIRYRYRVHEQVIDSCVRRGDVPVLTEIAVRHSGYESAEGARRKRARNVRLLRLDLRDDPDDPWLLFQVGRDLLRDDFEQAEGLLLAALDRSDPGHSLVRKGLSLLASGYRERGRLAEAEGRILEGLARFPNDTTLLIEASALALGSGDPARAEAACLRLLAHPPDADEFLGGVDLDARGWRARHNLGMAYLARGKAAEAEAQWRVALLDRPDAAPLWLGLAEAALAGGRRRAFRDALARIEAFDPPPHDLPADAAAILRARARAGATERRPASRFGPGRIPPSYRRPRSPRRAPLGA